MDYKMNKTLYQIKTVYVLLKSMKNVCLIGYNFIFSTISVTFIRQAIQLRLICVVYYYLCQVE